MIPQYIPDIFKVIVARVSAAIEAAQTNPTKVFFDHGHYRRVCQNLSWKDNSISEKDKKYPLIWMVTDFDEHMGEHPGDYVRTTGLQFIIAAATNPDWTMEERRD